MSTFCLLVMNGISEWLQNATIDAIYYHCAVIDQLDQLNE